jgi:hypothetical protein
LIAVSRAIAGFTGTKQQDDHKKKYNYADPQVSEY